MEVAGTLLLSLPAVPGVVEGLQLRLEREAAGEAVLRCAQGCPGVLGRASCGRSAPGPDSRRCVCACGAHP